MIKFKIGKKTISNNSPTYFIADIAANHDGSLLRAKRLIRLCAKAGADAAKFQHFKAETIIFVSHNPENLKYCNSIFEMKNRNLTKLN